MSTFKKAIMNMAKKVAFEKHSTSLKAGDKAPSIHGLLQDETQYDAKNYEGKKIVLYFYPKDSTPGCTAQACSLRDNYTFMMKSGYEVIGVSADSPKKHQNFIKKYSLPFPLIADTEMELIKAYDVWGQKQFMGRVFDGIIRTTFIINEKGIIDEVITDIDTTEHASQVLHK